MTINNLSKLLIIGIISVLLFICNSIGANSVQAKVINTNTLGNNIVYPTKSTSFYNISDKFKQDSHTLNYKKYSNVDFAFNHSNISGITITNFKRRIAKGLDNRPIVIHPNGTQKDPFLIAGNAFANHTIEYDYINNGDPIIIKEIKLDDSVIGANQKEYKLVKMDLPDSCHYKQKNGITINRLEGCKIRLQGNLKSMENQLEKTGTHNIKIKVPEFKLEAADGEVIPVVPPRLFSDRGDAKNVYVKAGYLVPVTKSIIIDNTRNNTITLQTDTSYIGQKDFSYLGDKIVYKFTQLPRFYEIIGGHDCKTTRNSTEIEFDCPIVLAQSADDLYSIPARDIKIKFTKSDTKLFSDIIVKTVVNTDNILGDMAMKSELKLPDKVPVIVKFNDPVYRPIKLLKGMFSSSTGEYLEGQRIKAYLGKSIDEGGPGCINKNFCFAQIPLLLFDNDWVNTNMTEVFKHMENIDDMFSSKWVTLYLDNQLEITIPFTCKIQGQNGETTGKLVVTRQSLKSEMQRFDCGDG